MQINYNDYLNKLPEPIRNKLHIYEQSVRSVRLQSHGTQKEAFSHSDGFVITVTKPIKKGCIEVELRLSENSNTEYSPGPYGLGRSRQYYLYYGPEIQSKLFFHLKDAMYFVMEIILARSL